MLRRLFVFVSVLCFALLSYSQDIIVTTRATRIQAHVIEVGEHDVAYRMFGVKDSRLYTIPLSDVVTIVFENGKVLLLQSQNRDSTSHSSSQPSPSLLAQTCPPLPGAITKHDNAYFLNTQEGTIRMSEDAYLRFIAHNSPETWQYYQKADHLWSLGWRFFGSGLAGLVLGAPVWGTGVYLETTAQSHQPEAYYGKGMSFAGIILMSAGAALTITSIPMLAVGQHRRKHSHEVYNACYLDQQSLSSLSSLSTHPSPTFSVRTTPCSLGCAIHF